MKTLSIFSFFIIAFYLAFHFLTKENELPAWQIVKPEHRNIIQSVQAGGVMEAKEQVDVGAQVTGQVVKLHVSEGEKVTKGQLLAEIDPTIARNNLKTAESNLAKAHAMLKKVNATHQLNALALKRHQTLYASRAVSSSDKEKTEADYAISRADVDNVKTDIINAEVAVEIARSELSYNMISAPVDGTVVSILSREGQTLVSTQTVPILLRLGTLELMTVKTRIAEADVVKLKTGFPVKFTLIGQPDRFFYARLNEIQLTPANYNEATTQSSGNAVYYYATFDIPNTDNYFRIGMTVNVNIEYNSRKNVLSIPLAALKNRITSHTATVEVLRKGVKVNQEIEIGPDDQLFVEVISGLTPDDEVVLGAMVEKKESIDEGIFGL